MSLPRKRSSKIHPWTKTTAKDLQNQIDKGLAKRQKTVSIESALLGLCGNKEIRREAKEVLQAYCLEDILETFLERPPQWVVRCFVTDSMASSEWGLKTFSIGKRAYLYHETGGEESVYGSLPIIGAWEPKEDDKAFRDCFLKSYRKWWQEFGLPPLIGQWAIGPHGLLLEALCGILKAHPEQWPGVLTRLGDERHPPSFVEIVESTAGRTMTQRKLVGQILEPFFKDLGCKWIKRDADGKDITDYRKRTEIKENKEKSARSFTELERRIFLSAFLHLISKSV